MLSSFPTHLRILCALLMGALLGLLAHPLQDNLWVKTLFLGFFASVGQIFLSLIFMMIVPLITSALILSSYRLNLQQNAGHIAKKAILGSILFAAMAGLLAFLVAPLSMYKPLDEASLTQLQGVSQHCLPIPNTSGFVLGDWIAKNPVAAMAKALEGGSIIPVMIFSAIIGFALARSSHPKKELLVDLCEIIQQVCFSWIHWVMRHLAPWAITALVAASLYSLGFKLLSVLSGYIFAVILGLLLQQFVVYGFVLKYLARISPLHFFKQIQEVLTTAFSTSSSSATLPVSLDVATRKLKLPADSSRLVLTLGSSANQNGSALYEGVSVLFLCYLFGLDLSFDKQLSVMAMCMAASLGTAGVPGGTIPMMASILESLGVPSCSLLLILGVDRLLDMLRTTVNVTGDLVLAQWIARNEIQNDGS
jgi:DAACS family dicarboxylate/amino acid:cation (Na+ or H+) symporter